MPQRDLNPDDVDTAKQLTVPAHPRATSRNKRADDDRPLWFVPSMRTVGAIQPATEQPKISQRPPLPTEDASPTHPSGDVTTSTTQQQAHSTTHFTATSKVPTFPSGIAPQLATLVACAFALTAATLPSTPDPWAVIASAVMLVFSVHTSRVIAKEHTTPLLPFRNVGPLYLVISVVAVAAAIALRSPTIAVAAIFGATTGTLSAQGVSRRTMGWLAATALVAVMTSVVSLPIVAAVIVAGVAAVCVLRTALLVSTDKPHGADAWRPSVAWLRTYITPLHRPGVRSTIGQAHLVLLPVAVAAVATPHAVKADVVPVLAFCALLTPAALWAIQRAGAGVLNGIAGAEPDHGAVPSTPHLVVAAIFAWNTCGVALAAIACTISWASLNALDVMLAACVVVVTLALMVNGHTAGASWTLRTHWHTIVAPAVFLLAALASAHNPVAQVMTIAAALGIAAIVLPMTLARVITLADTAHITNIKPAATPHEHHETPHFTDLPAPQASAVLHDLPVVAAPLTGDHIQTPQTQVPEQPTPEALPMKQTPPRVLRRRELRQRAQQARHS